MYQNTALNRGFIVEHWQEIEIEEFCCGRPNWKKVNSIMENWVLTKF